MHWNYTECLEENEERIFEYFEKDFVFTKKAIPSSIWIQYREQP